MSSNIFDIIDSSIKHNTLESDYKAEIIALNLLKYYDEIDQVFLKRLGSNNRSFNKEIESISSQAYELGELIVSISSNQEGLYDYLPEGIFHPPSLGKHNLKIDDIIYQIQKQRKIEDDARTFFQPFELESFFIKVNALSKENEYEVTDDTTTFLLTFKKLWPLLNHLDEEVVKTFIFILPFFHTIRGNRKWFEKCMSSFLKIPVSVDFIPNYVDDVKNASEKITLSNFSLGDTMVLSGEHFDGEKNWIIKYGQIPYDSIIKYIPHSNLRKLLKILYDYCLPVTVEVKEYFIVDRREDSFCLDKNKDANRLGFSTFL